VHRNIHLCVILLDQIRALLSDAIGWHLGVSSVQNGHHTTISHAESRDAPDTKPLVEDGLRVIGLAHAASSGGVVACDDVVVSFLYIQRRETELWESGKGDTYMSWHAP
jgi:hypothetical protein